MRTQALLLPFLAVSIFILSSCAAVDLVPLRSDGSARPDNEPVAYCKFGGAGLIVTIKNQGNDNAPSSVTSVIFHIRGGGDVVRTINTPPLAAGASYSRDVPMPIGCSAPDCPFNIVADSSSVVFESNENNNNVMGLCTG